MAPAPEGSFTQLAAVVAEQLSAIYEARDTAVNDYTWEAAEYYVTAFASLQRAWEAEHGKPLRADRDKGVINNAIRAMPQYRGPGGSWLSDAKRTYEMFQSRFRSGTRPLPFQHYKLVAVCSLSSEEKHELVAWAESERVTREAIRLRIHTLTDAKKGISTPDFDLKVSNSWHFNAATTANGFDGGIHPDLVANLLYYCTKPGDVVIDPMAGGDTTYRVVTHYQYFQAMRPEMDGSGPRTVLRADIAPIHADITQADITEQAPWPAESADFCLLDPPYFLVAKGKYGTFGKTIEEWRENLRHAMLHCREMLKPGGKLAVITDDYLRSGACSPLGFYAGLDALALGLTISRRFFNPYPNFLSMSPAEMARYKQKKAVVNGMKEIVVWQKA
jgi:hypothetical protein